MKRKPADEKYVPVQLRLHPRDVERLRALGEQWGLSLGATVATLLVAARGQCDVPRRARISAVARSCTSSASRS